MDSLLQKYSDLSERLASDLSQNVSYTDSNNNENGSNSDSYIKKVSSAKGDKYSLRPRSSKRFTELEEDSKVTKKSQKSTKQKPPPLSKYRRKTANARERNRMREINQAFETLRAIIPHGQIHHQPPSNVANEKLTKITTLRLAMKYINTLSAALSPSNDLCENFDFDSCKDLECFLLESDGDSLSLSEHSLMTSPDFQDTSLSPVEFGDSSFPSLLQTDFAENTLGTSGFEDFFFS